MTTVPSLDTAPLVSVLMPVHNCAQFLRESVTSILEQSYTNFEFIIVDDGSTDDGDYYLKSISDSRVKLLRNSQNLGVVNSLNYGLAASNGKYIARMDGDDISLKTRLETQVRFLEKHSETVVVGSFIENIDRLGNALGLSTYPTEDADIREALKTGAPFAHPSTLIRRSALASVGGYRRQFVCAEDYDLWLRLAEVGRLHNLSNVLLRYRNHPQSTTVKSAYQVRLGVLIAQMSAQHRLSGRADPIEPDKLLSNSDLDRLGIDQRSRETMRLLSEIDTSKRLLSMGEFSLANASVISLKRVSTVPLNIQSEIAVLQARIAIETSGILTGIAGLIVAAILNPLILTSISAKAIRIVVRAFKLV